MDIVSFSKTTYLVFFSHFFFKESWMSLSIVFCWYQVVTFLSFASVRFTVLQHTSTYASQPFLIFSYEAFLTKLSLLPLLLILFTAFAIAFMIVFSSIRYLYYVDLFLPSKCRLSSTSLPLPFIVLFLTLQIFIYHESTIHEYTEFIDIEVYEHYCLFYTIQLKSKTMTSSNVSWSQFLFSSFASSIGKSIRLYVEWIQR